MSKSTTREIIERIFKELKRVMAGHLRRKALIQRLVTAGIRKEE